MKNALHTLFSSLLVIFIFSPILLQSQDTLRVNIPDLAFNLYPTEVEVPVYIDYSGEVRGLQFALGYDTSFLRLDTLQFNINDTSPLAAYAEGTLGRIRILYTDLLGSNFNFVSDSVAMRLRFSVLDSIKSGFSPIEFIDDISTLFLDEDNNPITTIRTGGSVVTGALGPELSMAVPVFIESTEEVCVNLRSVLVPPVTGFDLGLAWDTSAFRLTRVNTLSNPLQLQTGEIISTPTSLRLLRQVGISPPTATLTEGAELLQVCFQGQSADSYSELDYVASDTAFALNTIDAGDVAASGNFTGSYLAYENSFLDTVRLRLRSSSRFVRDSTHCLEIWSENLPPLNRFSFELGWPDAEVALEQSISFGTELNFAEYGTVAASDSGLVVSYLLPENEISPRLRAVKLLKLCLAGPQLQRCTGYNVRLRETTVSPAEFTGRYTTLQEDRPLPYEIPAGRTGIPFVDTFRLSLTDTMIPRPEDSIFSVLLRAETEVCLNATDGSIYVPTILAEFIGQETLLVNPSVQLTFQRDTFGGYSFDLENLSTDEYGHLPPGDLMRLSFRRLLPLDTFPISLFMDSYIYEDEDFDFPWIPIENRNGRIIFETPVATQAEAFIRERLPLYPNPTTDRVNIDIVSWRGAEVSVFNTQGQLLRNGLLEHSGFSLKDLPSGTYFLIMAKDGRIGRASVIKSD